MTQTLEPGALQAIGTTPALTTAGASYANTTGTITTATSTVTTGNIGAAGNVTAYLYGTHAGVNVTFEISPDNTNWFPVSMNREDNGLADTTSGPLPANAVRAWTMGAPGLNFFRVRATAWTSGTANVVIVSGTYPFEPLVAVRPRLVATYGAAYRVAVTTGNLWLGPTFVANTDKQLATIYHAASATKTVRIRFFSITLEGAGGSAGTFGFEIRQLSATTAPATGAPAITPRSFDSSDAAAEATCLALPGTAGSDAAVNSPVSNHFVWFAGVGAAVVDPSRAGQEIVLHNSRDAFDRKPLTMRAGVAEGFALVGRCNAATSLNYTAYAEFTEEAP